MNQRDVQELDNLLAPIRSRDVRALVCSALDVPHALRVRHDASVPFSGDMRHRYFAALTAQLKRDWRGGRFVLSKSFFPKASDATVASAALVVVATFLELPDLARGVDFSR